MKIELNKIFKDKKDDVEYIRKGALEKNELNLNVKKNGIKILSSMILLFTLTLSISHKKDFEMLFKKAEINPKKESSIAVFASNDNEEDKIVLASLKKEEILVFGKPIKGEISKMYSRDKVIFSKTLNQWKTHSGIDVIPTSDTTVKSAEKGVVTNIYDDDFMGKTIEIEHIAGYRTLYSNLDENIYVNIGESVIKGQKIGKVGKSAISESLDEAHLHFEVFQNNNSINPTYIYD